MNDDENLNSSLIDEFAVPVSKHNCCYYLFCCFFCNANKKTNSRKFYINKWRKYLSKETDSKNKIKDPFRILTNLWAHKNVIRDLEQIRLNPNLLSKNQIRNDLEFYIPQLCTFMLFGEYETVEEFLAFLCKACFASFSFAHRIVWFLKSLMHPQNSYNEKIRSILHLIQTIFKSENKKHILERLHVAGSKKFIEYLQKTKIFPTDLNNLDENSVISLEEINNQIEKRREIRESLDRYIDKQYSLVINEEANTKSNILLLSSSSNSSTENNIELKLEPENIHLSTFKRYDSVTNDEDNILTQYVKQIDMEDINLSSFLSNINFIDHLCNICEIVRYVTPQEQNKTLLNELKKVNKILPSNVYLPFLKDSIRNYVIAQIPLSEVKIFKTKNRAPYLITVECFRLDELTFNLLSKTDDYSSKTNNSSSSNEEEDILKTGNDIKLEKIPKNKIKKIKPTTSSDFDRQRSLSFKDSLLNSNENKKSKTNRSNENSEIILTNDSKFDQKNFILPDLNKSSDVYTQMNDRKQKTFIEPNMGGVINKENKKSMNNLNKYNYLLESDVNISKPVVIKNILSQNVVLKEMGESGKKKKKKNLPNYEDLDYETDPEDYKKIEKVVKNDFQSKNNSPKHSPNNSEVKIPQVDDSSDEEEIKIKIKQDNTSQNTNNNSNSKMEKLEIENDNNSNNLSFDDHSDPLNLNPNEKSNPGRDIIFGEKIEEQTERLKKISPFGLLNTYKLMKIIVKSGEDLRQEQFATQLINEFYQIFKMEKVDCWVNPYEILATGNNVGIIEVVPNAISIDQLKKRSKQITSLRNFYEVYFAPVNSMRYKKAMKNFISSLAGYSLVCYFLQIKDRHNANIMIDDEGHLIHIDFGFMLSNAPGKGLQFEKAPFKFTKEFVDVMGGVNSKYFTKFRKLLWKGFLAIVNNYEKILILVEMMYCGHGNKLPCFEKGQIAIEEIRSRFVPRPNMKTRDYMKHVDSLIEQSIDNWRTKWYDKYQYWVQGIFY